MSASASLLPCGFCWGVAKVLRIMEHKGSIVIGIETPREELQIMVTPTGLIRIGDKRAIAHERARMSAPGGG